MQNKSRFGAIALLALVAAFWPAIGAAQTMLTQTTLSAAVAAGARSLSVASATDIAAGGEIFVESPTTGGELMRVTAVSGTTLTVRRGTGGTPSTPTGPQHASGARVWVDINDAFTTFDVSGACTSSDHRYLPHINTRSGEIWDCDPGVGVWLKRSTDPVKVAEFTVRDDFANTGHTVMQDDGTIKSVTDAEINYVTGSPLGAITYRQEQTATISSWITING